MNYEALKTLIERLGVHPQLGPVGEGWNIEQNPHELATFFSSLPSISTVLEIGTGYQAGLARFMHECMGWTVTSVDIIDYGHQIEGIRFLVGRYPVWGERFDLVIIDGDHHYDSVRSDFEFYRDYAPIVAFHDIAGLRDCAGVAKLWKQLAHTRGGNLRKHCYEVIAEGEQRAGLGWIVQ